MVALSYALQPGPAKPRGFHRRCWMPGWPAPDTDVVLLGADSIDDLGRLADLATRIRPNGAIWVVSRKGTTRTLRDVDVIDAAKASGLVDNKGASFSATHTALRLVIPLARRPRG